METLRVGDKVGMRQICAELTCLVFKAEVSWV